MLNNREQKLLDRLEPFAADNGIEIVTLEVIGSKKSPVVRVYIDTEGGVSFNELSAAQDWIGKLFDEIDPFPGAYTLEVSSPGIDRPLRTPEHFKRFVGEDVRICTLEAVNGSTGIKGVLVDASDDEIKVDRDGEELDIAIGNIKRANVIGKVEF